jgi:hypothetical protein
MRRGLSPRAGSQYHQVTGQRPASAPNSEPESASANHSCAEGFDARYMKRDNRRSLESV